MKIMATSKQITIMFLEKGSLGGMDGSLGKKENMHVLHTTLYKYPTT